MTARVLPERVARQQDKEIYGWAVPVGNVDARKNRVEETAAQGAHLRTRQPSLLGPTPPFGHPANAPAPVRTNCSCRPYHRAPPVPGLGLQQRCVRLVLFFFLNDPPPPRSPPFPLPPPLPI